MKKDITILGRKQDVILGKVQDIIAERGIDELSDIIVEDTIII
ncbi:hypothetical protein [Sphingobacterium sp. 1.A.4]|nr:hypothetical protein [Sphingobacterium sp. 1.A.4]